MLKRIYMYMHAIDRAEYYSNKVWGHTKWIDRLRGFKKNIKYIPLNSPRIVFFFFLFGFVFQWLITTNKTKLIEAELRIYA